MKTKYKGFTLLEIILTITLIGILASIALVAINPNMQLTQTRDLTRQDDITQLQQALEVYAVRNSGDYPTGIEVGIYKEICGDISTNNCVDLKGLLKGYLKDIPKDPKGNNYLIGINPENNSISLLAQEAEQGEMAINKFNVSTIINQQPCPAGYVRVPGNTLYETQDFCVMKYEAKAVSITNPTVGLTEPNTGYNTIDNDSVATTSINQRAVASVASGYPIARISQETAATYCTNIGANLISNAEWMTIARNIEAQNSNWRNGIIGSLDSEGGGIWKGHSTENQGTALAASTDNNPYFGTGKSTPSREKRTHTLSNGSIIWDLSGNTWEWLIDTIEATNKPNTNSGDNWQEWTAINNYGTLGADSLRPNNSWNSSQNMGKYLAGTVTGNNTFVFRRGGDWFDTISAAGIFALSLTSSSTNSFGFDTGFRCVIR